ncbi:FGGY family carbohydrate kinase [Paractinoplanes rishiriensis]|uniref:Carbohydrate kinase FGGY N-terminal domain-containing protein n=1 Tax=Paractinoplanes rishiriensis TaxID=1050105 RepID=A0A919JUA0_9ACTN|nr:FGGY family carbohydrate kinase [Actinoplanes rishiriensis]GIE94920.1 hypothetical protein Ari01nite_23850 [Actinoplanes rishiriensis]
MSDDLVLAIDQCTSSTKCLLVDPAGMVVREENEPVPIRYPPPGCAEQDAGEILDSVLTTATRCLNGVPRSAVRGDRNQHPARVGDRPGPPRPAGPTWCWPAGQRT